MGIIEMLLQSVDALLIGGAMANTFLCAQGHQLGYSRVEEDKLALARSIIQKAKERGVELLLPSDLRVAKSLESSEFEEVSVSRVPADTYALDIGSDTCARYRERLRRALSVFWNGPMGLFENSAYAEGTKVVARAIAESPGFTVVGGGDSVAAVEQTGLAKRFSHVSTGGGASLVYLECGKLPGVEALKS
jgi:phosphoglycerate kinase